MKKKLIIFLPIVLILSIFIFFLFTKDTNELEVELVDKVEVSINEEIYNTQYVKSVKNGNVVTDKERIDTTKVGEQEIIIKIKDEKDKEKEYSYKVIVYDKESPVVTFNKEIKTDYGVKVDLLKDVKVVDNSNEEIKAIVEGEYSFNEAGTYNLYYVAKDSSGNETKEEFTLIVNKKKVEEPKEETKEKTEEKVNDTTFTTSKGFSGYTKNGITYIDGVLVVNKTYSLPSNYGPGLTSKTKEAFNEMKAAATLEGLNIYLSSGFRSYTTQKNLYNRYVNRDGQAAADTYSARPGHSEHQSGLAFDVNQINDTFNDTAEAKWLANNCYKYGFILRYPKGKTNETGYKYESWHFRYVGVDLATRLYNGGDWITLESYFGITSEYK